ncbi:MAG: hypothetical protein IPG51_00865 [Chloroflexi bacterium]|nr:hypothetical protein [Chloroflexota bacterium]
MCRCRQRPWPPPCTTPPDLREQLGVIQELLGLAEAQSVTLRGKISVDLHAEVAF